MHGTRTKNSCLVQTGRTVVRIEEHSIHWKPKRKEKLVVADHKIITGHVIKIVFTIE